tara:strand:- start:7 stop:675 length:669 start_codon:yes stop_codon:yes gene_type:complete
MSIIYTPESDLHLFAPFGPTMGYYRMPDELVEQLNSKMSDKLDDYSDQLVGKVSEELAFDDDIISIAQKGLGQFIGKYQAYSDHRNSMGAKKLNTEKFNYGLQIVSGWFVRQFENEYNPLHIHTGSRLSCVGYLKLPEGIEEEWEEDYKDHHPSNGHIQFAAGTSAGYTCTNFIVKPQVGDFYVFPSHLFHCVYPFYTKGERRSFSMNMNFIEVPKEKKVDK